MATKTYVNRILWGEVKPLWVRHNGSWRETEIGHMKKGSSWKKVYLRSDPKTHIYDSNWHGVYNNGTLYTGSQRDRLGYQGHQSSFSRLEGTLYGFDYAKIQSELAIRPTIVSVTVESECRWSYYGSGKTFDWSSHDYASKPSSGVSWRSIDASVHYLRGERKIVTLGTNIGEGFRDGSILGLSLPYTGSSQQWGYMAATYTTTTLVASPSDAQTRIAYGREKPRITIVSDY